MTGASDFLKRIRQRWHPGDQRDAERAAHSVSDSSEDIERSARTTARAVCTLLETPNLTALNLGCGYGRVDKYIAPHVKTLYLVDVSENMLRLAKARLSEFKNVVFVQGDGQALSTIEDAQIDLVYTMFVLQHLPKEIAFRCLLEMNRVLKPDAKVLLQFPNAKSRFYREDFLYNAVFGEEDNPARVRSYFVEEVEWLVKTAGFDCAEVLEEGYDGKYFNRNEISVIGRKSGVVTLGQLRRHAADTREGLKRGEWS